jgi:hypothetical protein
MAAFTSVTGYEVRGFPCGSGRKLVVGTAVGTASYDATTGSTLDLSSYFNGDVDIVDIEALGLVGYEGHYVAGTGPDDGTVLLFDEQVTGGLITHGNEVTTGTDLKAITFQWRAYGDDA